jgi:hypothetical protein
MRLEDLPAADQRAIRSGRARAPEMSAAGRPARPRGQAGRWHCRGIGGCGEAFAAYARAERHIDQTHRAGRLDWTDR